MATIPQICLGSYLCRVCDTFRNKDLMYEVSYSDGEGEVHQSSSRMTYAANCPVIVERDGSVLLEGIVLLCENSSTDTSSSVQYTVMFTEEDQARYEMGIAAECIKYRKMETPGEEHLDTTVVASRSQKEHPHAKSTVSAQVSRIQPDVETVSSSITCESTAKGGSTTNKMSSNNKNHDFFHKETGTDMASGNNDVLLAYYGPACHSDVATLEVKIPYWLQRDRETQFNLFCKLQNANVPVVILFQTRLMKVYCRTTYHHHSFI